MFPRRDILGLEENRKSSFKLVYNMSRLEGGSNLNDPNNLDDVLDLSETEDVPPPKKVTVTPVKSEILLEPPKISKLRLAIKYSKMVVIVCVLLTAIVLLARVKEWEYDEERYVVVQSDKLKTLKLSGFNHEQNKLEIKLKGAFLAVEKCSDVNGKKMPSLRIFITQGEKEDARQIGHSWKTCLQEPSKFDTAKDVEKQRVFDLEDSTKDPNVFINLQTVNVNEDLFVTVYINTSPVDQKKGVILGTIILVFLYSMIVTEIIDRTFASLIAAALSLGVLALCNSKVGQDELISWIDVETLAVLIGMMLLVSILAESGIFDYFAVFAYKMAKGRVWPLINCLSFFTAFLAMFLDSVTMMLLATPVTIRLCEVLALNPVPVLICMVVFANVGAASTPIGDPPNLIITLDPVISEANVNFSNFILHMCPGVALGLVQTYFHIRLLYRKPQSLRFKEPKELQNLRHEIAVWERTAAGISPYTEDEDVALIAIHEKIQRLKERLEEQINKSDVIKPPASFEETLAHLKEQYPLRDKVLLYQASAAFIFVMILFFICSIPNVPTVGLGWSALLGALLLLIISDRRDLEAILVRIEWTTLLFFAALFIVMRSLAILGVIELIGSFVVHVISRVKADYQLALAIVIVVWVSGIASAFLDNIPVTTMMVKIVDRLSQDTTLKLPLHPLVWSLAFGACFGGNGTLIGASANLVTAGVAEQHGYKISFLKFFNVCFPIMLGNISVATVYLLICHVAFSWHD